MFCSIQVHVNHSMHVRSLMFVVSDFSWIFTLTKCAYIFTFLFMLLVSVLVADDVISYFCFLS